MHDNYANYYIVFRMSNSCLVWYVFYLVNCCKVLIETPTTCLWNNIGET